MDKGMEVKISTSPMGQTLYQRGGATLRDQEIARPSSDELFKSHEIEQHDIDETPKNADRRTGPEAASTLIDRAKQEGPSHALHDLGEGNMFEEQKQSNITDINDYRDRKNNNTAQETEQTAPNQNENASKTEPSKRQFDLKMYNVIWKGLYEEQVKSGKEIDIDAINKQAEQEYEEYQEYKAAKEGKESEPIKNETEELKKQKELTPEQRIVALQEHVKELSATQTEMREQLDKVKDDYEMLRKSTIALAEAFTAYLEKEKKNKKDEDEASFLEILIKLVNKILSEMFTLEEYSGKDPKKGKKDEPTFRILQVSNDNPKTNAVGMNEYKKGKATNKPEENGKKTEPIAA